MKEAGVDLLENFPTEQIRATFKQMLDDWTNAGFDPFAAPQETGTPYGRKNGNNTEGDHARARARQALRRHEGRPAAAHRRARRADQPRLRRRRRRASPSSIAEPGFENEVHAFNLFGFLSRSARDLEPELHLGRASTASCARPPRSTSCPSSTATTASSGSSRCPTRSTGTRRQEHRQAAARVTMKAGDMAAMPADIRHQGYSPKRSMLLVWENGSPTLRLRDREGRVARSAGRVLRRRGAAP